MLKLLKTQNVFQHGTCAINNRASNGVKFLLRNEHMFFSQLFP